MQIADYIAQVTGKPIAELFALGNPLVAIEQDAEGEMRITRWDSSLSVPQPSEPDIQTALAAADPVVVPESVSARQFKLQLLAESLLDQVDAWVSGQSKAVQIAYEYSGQFLRSEPMMATGFAALNFTAQQIDDFYIAAAKL